MHWQDCSQSPGEVSAQKDAARTIRQQEEDLQKLQDRVGVLAHAKETDGRRFKQIAVERQREREELKREVERLKVSHHSIVPVSVRSHSIQQLLLLAACGCRSCS